MSGRAARALVCCAALCAGIGAAHADQISDLNDEITLLALKVKAAQSQLDLINVQIQIANNQKTIADDLKTVAEDELAKAEDALKKPVPPAPPIKMSAGSLYVIGDPQRSCNALPFLRWQCNGSDSCNFTVDDKMCGLPGASTEPMELSLAYQCGSETMKDVFPYNRPAQLTCK